MAYFSGNRSCGDIDDLKLFIEFVLKYAKNLGQRGLTPMTIIKYFEEFEDLKTFIEETNSRRSFCNATKKKLETKKIFLN